MRPHRLGIPFWRVDPRSNRGRTHVDLANERLRLEEPVYVFEHRVAERRELLAKRHGHCILKLRATHLEERREFLPLREESIRKITHRMAEIFDRRVQC